MPIAMTCFSGCQDALVAKDAPLTLCTWRMEQRERRPLKEQVRDGVEVCLEVPFVVPRFEAPFFGPYGGRCSKPLLVLPYKLGCRWKLLYLSIGFSFLDSWVVGKQKGPNMLWGLSVCPLSETAKLLARWRKRLWSMLNESWRTSSRRQKPPFTRWRVTQSWWHQDFYI